MSVKATAAAWDLDVGPMAKLVALAIAEGAPDDDDFYESDIEHVREMTGLPEVAIHRAIDVLTDCDGLERQDLFRWRFRV
jgi:hypothetical protein